MCFFCLQQLYHKFTKEEEDSRRTKLQKSLEVYAWFILLLSFIMTPAVTKDIFSTFDCTKYQLEDKSCDGEKAGCNERSFLTVDLTVVCSDRGVPTAEHNHLQVLAYIYMMMWPIGMPLIYLAVLVYPRWGNKHALRQQRQMETWPIKATRFLHEEYSPHYFWWEVLALLQRLILYGFVLIIPVEQDIWRIFIGLLVALGYLTLLQFVQPCMAQTSNPV